MIIKKYIYYSLSDAFGQQFGATETRVNGIDNLYAMEIDPKVDFSQMANVMNRNDASGGDGGVNSLLESANANFLSDLSSSVPGIDEAMSFAEIFKQVKKKDFSCIVFDTAPTGHTLRLLSFPTVLQKAIVKIDGLRSKFGGLFQNFANMLNQNGSMQNDNNVNAAEMIEKKLKEMKDSVDEIKKQFENCDLTTFVCVCIPEFLSLYETERLIQKLAKFGIDSHNIVINQVLYPEKGSNCKRCQARVKMQSKYISQFDDLYPDFNLVKIPLMNTEVRHLKRLKQYAHWLVNSYQDAYESNDYNDSVLDLNDANDANDKDGKDKNNNKNNSNENETKTDDDDNDNDNDNDGVDVIDVD